MKTQMPTTKLLTSGEVAVRLGISDDGVRLLVRRGELQPIRYGGGWLRYERHDVDALIRRAREGSSSG